MIGLRDERPLRWIVSRASILGGVLLFLAAEWYAPPIYIVVAVVSLAAVAAILRHPVAGLCLLAFSVPWGSGYPVTVAGFPVSSTDALIAITVGACLASALAARENPIASTVWIPYVLLFLAAISVSAVGASDPRASGREIVKWIELALVYLAASRCIRGKPELNYVIVAVVAAGASQAMVGYIQAGFQLGPDAFVHGRFLRAYGSFDQPNPYAGYLNMVMPLALAMGARASSRAQRALYHSAFVLIAGALVLSQSRGALLASIAALFVVALCLWPAVARPVFALMLGFVAEAWAASLNLVPLGPFQRLLTAVGLGSVSFDNVTTTNFSAVERAAHWLAGVRMFADHPLVGVGIGNYTDAYPAYHPRGWYAALAHAHNYYINIAAEAGTVGLAAYLLLIGSALWYSYATMRRAEDRVYEAALLGLLGALIATGLHNLFDVLYVHGTVALLGLLMAFVPVAARQGRMLVGRGSAEGHPATRTGT